MDEQEKEIEEILRTFDKAPSPSSENSVQNQAQQNNKQPRQISQKPTDTERIARTSNQTEYKRQAQSSKGSGAMLLTLADYDFTYEIRDNQLYIDFVNDSAHDATYEFSVKGDTLTLIGGEGTIGGTYELTKVHDKKADK